jgi:microcystin-dependent protein
MSQPFIAQIVMFGGNFAPRNWSFCDGQLLPINNFQALFSLVGTIYGGDGRTTLALPDLRGRVAMHAGSGPGLTPRPLGQRSGVETVTLTAAQIAPHTHPMRGNSGEGEEASPLNGVPANSGDNDLYAPGSNVNMGTTAQNSGGQAHPNIQPFLCVNFIIALQGLFPSRN